MGARLSAGRRSQEELERAKARRRARKRDDRTAPTVRSRDPRARPDARKRVRKPYFKLIYRGNPVRTIYNISGFMFLTFLVLTLVLLVVFGSIPEAPMPWNLVMTATLVVWVLSTMTLCGVMIYEIIARLLGKPTTFGIAILGGRYIRDVDGSTHVEPSPHTNSKQRKR